MSKSNIALVMHLLMLLLDLAAVIIYVDLYMVLRHKKHLFTIALEKKWIAQKQLKPYQQVYYDSLRRDWFCILDKVRVDMPCMTYCVDLLMACTSIAVVFNLLDLMGVHLGILRPTGSQLSGFAYAHVVFYMQFMTWFYSMMLALTNYRDLKRELCFHCKYGFFIIQSLNILLLMAVVMEYTPKWTIFSMFAFIALVYTSRADASK